MDNLILEKYVPEMLSLSDILTLFPEAPAQAKRNLRILRKQKTELEAICSPILDMALEGIHANKELSESSKTNIFVPIAILYFYDRHIDPLAKHINELERLLKIHSGQQPTDSGSVDLAKSIEISKVVRQKISSAHFISCPFHSEKTASCKLYKSRYHCFGCGEDGDVIDYVMKPKGWNFGKR